MKALIVHAHPEPKSFCTALMTTAADELRGQGDEVQVSDLYAMQFNPVASRADFLQPANPDYCVYALEQRHGVETSTIAPDIQAELEKLFWCDLLILNFPLFWCSTPAIMKGWIDRVLVSGKVYGGKRFYNLGVKPEWWKLAPMQEQGWRDLEALITERDRHCRGAVILGLNQPLDFLAASFANATNPIVKGFMVGRSLWATASLSWLNNEIDDEAFVKQVAHNYATLVDAWRKRK